MVNKLDSYRWKNRLFLIFAGSIADENFRAQTAILTKNWEGCLDRDLVVFPMLKEGKIDFGEKIDDNEQKELREKYRVTPEKFKVMLIGKDGGDKMSSDTPISAAKLFSVIDTMPMRQAEMR